jgi:CRP-like cAMP-binding protein
VFHPFLDQPCSDVPDLELSLLDGGERTATVVSETEMVVAVLSRVEFRSLQIAVPSIAYKMLAELGARLRHLYDTLAIESPGVLVELRSL